MEQTTCPYCEARPLGKRKGAKTCGDAECRTLHNRKITRERNAERRAAKRAEGVDETRTTLKECGACGQLFDADPRSSYCSVACSNKARAGDPDEVAARRAERNFWRRARECPVAFGECAACGRTYSFDPRWARTFCSEPCARTVRNGRHRRWRKFAPRVYARDSFTCWLCGAATLTEYVMGDPLSPSLDHVVPRSRGGEDSMSNLRTAHMICNALRGDREDVVSIDIDALVAREASHELAA